MLFCTSLLIKTVMNKFSFRDLGELEDEEVMKA